MPSTQPGQVTLADGTRLADLIDRENRTFRARIHSDLEIYQLELERIFARAWIPVAHVSEFREPGDFVTRSIGRDPVLVTMDASGEHHVMLNACTHRGAQVCAAEAGNTSVHRCPFHSWSFGVDGKLIAVPQERFMYGDRLNRSELGLRHARVGVAAGIVFATWDESAPSLDDFIGDFRFYLDTMLSRTDAGMEVAGPPQRFIISANWKVVTEGFFGDSYHVASVHQSFVDIELYKRSVAPFFKVSINGHASMSVDLEGLGITGPAKQVLSQMVPPGTPPELMGEAFKNLSPEQIALLAETPPSVAGLFPTTAILQITSGPSSPIEPTVSLRFFVPLSVNQTEVVSFALVERDASPEFKARAQRWTISSFGVGGMFEADDTEVWASVQRSVQGVIGRQLRDNYQSVGILVEDPIRPGVTKYRGVPGDDLPWHFYERYFEMLEAK
jgi:phenylpropionate dioxygenase-like ring-hydroxylating dioxygenase large terminal subunit